MDKTCSEKCLLKIALLQFDWKLLGRRLLNTEQDVKDIDHDEKEEQDKREKVLLKWNEQQGSGATYQKLIDTLKEVGNKDTAERVEQLAVDEMLDKVCSGDHLLEMSSWDYDWKSVIVREQDTATSDHAEDNEQQKRKKVLTKWKEQQGSGATYRRLIDTIKERDVANKVHHLATTVPTLRGPIPYLVQNLHIFSEPFMFLDTSSLTQKEKDILLLKLEDDMKAILKQWDIVVSQFRSWMKANFSLDECKEILSSVPGMASEMKEVPMFIDREQQIVDAKNYLQCFVILSHYYSWFDCSILEAVVTSTEKDSSEFLSSLRSYTDRLHNYCKRNIFECPAPSSMSSTKGTTYLVLKLPGDQWSNAKNVTVEKIKKFNAELMKTFEIPNYALKLCTVNIGCVQLVYSIPLCIYNELFPLNEDQCKNLPMLGVMEVITKDYHYNKDHSTLQLLQPLSSKTIGADEKQEEAHLVQEDSSSIQNETGDEEKHNTQTEASSTEV
eukprot:Em0015g657a